MKLIRKLTQEADTSILDFIDTWKLPVDCWNFYQACRLSRQFRRWAQHHPQLTYLAATRQSPGVFDDPRAASLAYSMTAGSFPRLLRYAGLPPAPALAGIVRRLPPPCLDPHLCHILAIIAGDSRRFAILKQLSAPVFPEILDRLQPQSAPFSFRLIRSINDTFRKASLGKDNESGLRSYWPGGSRSTFLKPLSLIDDQYEMASGRYRRHLHDRLQRAHTLESLKRLLIGENNCQGIDQVSYFEGNTCVRPLKTPQAIKEASLRLDNCVHRRLHRYLVSILSGDSQLFVVGRRGESAMLEIVRVPEGSWRVNQFKGIRNTRPSGKLYRTARRWTRSREIFWAPDIHEDL